MPNKVSHDTQRILELHLEGKRNDDICELLGFSRGKVSSAILRARARGDAPPPVFTPPLEYVRRNGEMRRGSIGDIFNRLDANHCLWLDKRCMEQEYDSIAEFLLDLVLDEYERAKG